MISCFILTTEPIFNDNIRIYKLAGAERVMPPSETKNIFNELDT